MDDRTRKIILTTLAVVVGLFFIYILGDAFSPGSYAQAETYELDYEESEVIKAINDLKTDNPNIAGPDFLSDERIDGNLYKVYFYFKDENKIVYTWTRPSGKNSTTFAFVSLNDGLTLGNWKDINDDFGFSENRRLKGIFEERILKEVEKRLTTDN
ncbi:MAG: hypothetical protein HYZ44_11880 [Bacteroidetes bacterium]|nr:hypothetical protein [Bacteroidota bacterium]